MLQIKNLKVENNTGMTLIEEASFIMNLGEIVKLEGMNGSGKTTLLNAIFKNPDYRIVSGDIILNEKSVLGFETFEMVRAGMYLGLQFSPEIQGVSTIKFLYKAFQNIYKENKKSILDFKKELEEKCDMFYLDKSFLSKDLNLDYSGGQKKQASLIYALALMPKYLFLDEPDSGVDTESLAMVYKVVNYMKENGSAILLTSHNTETDNNLSFDRVYRIENKKLSIK